MTERKILIMDPDEGFAAEHDPTSDSFTLAGLTMAGSIGMANNRITGLPNTPTAGQDAVNQNYVDSLVSGLSWKEPCAVLGLVGNATVATINGLTPSAGDAYVVTDAGEIDPGDLTVAAGDLVEFDGDNWILIVANSGGYVPDGTRAILSKSTPLISPYTEATDDGKVLSFDGTSNTGADTGDAVDGNALLIADPGSVGYYDNLGYVYQGAVPTGEWIQFTGAGQIAAGAGLSKDGNTLNVNFGDGIKNDTDYVAVDLATSNPGLQFIGATPNERTLDVKLKASSGLAKDTNGIYVAIDDTPDTLDVDGDGLKVVGLPSLFKVNGTAVGANVTATNLDTLVNAGNADALHSHTINAVDEAKRVEETILNNVIVATGNAVRWSSTNNEIMPADNGSDAGARTIGIARTGGAANPGTSEVVRVGVAAGVLSGKTINTPIYLGASGALVEFSSVPRPGRIVRMGYMKNATDLDVQIQDFGYGR